MRKKWIGETASSVRSVTGLSDPVEGAVLLAEEFTLSCGVSKGAESLDLLASCLDAKIQVDNLQGEAGRLVPPHDDSEPYLIFVNQVHSLKRRNFSACHEMGHLLMPNYSPTRGAIRDLDTMRFNPQDEEEFLCDVAAAEILLPRRVFKARLNHEGTSVQSVFSLSREFGASLEATLLHIVMNSEVRVAGIVWRLDYDKNDATEAANGVLDFGEEWLDPVKKKWRVHKACTSRAMDGYYFTPRRSSDPDGPVARAGTCAANGNARVTRGWQTLKPSSGEREFYVESRGYSYYENPADSQVTTKVVSLVFPEDPWDER